MSEKLAAKGQKKKKWKKMDYGKKMGKEEDK